MLTEISFEKAKFWIGSEGILNCKYFNSDVNWKLRTSAVKKYILALLTLAADRPRPIIVDFRNVSGIYTIMAARLFVRDSSVNRIIISEAFIVNSLTVRLLVCVYKKIYDPFIPFKIFYNIKDAQEYSINQIELASKRNNNYEVETSH